MLYEIVTFKDKVEYKVAADISPQLCWANDKEPAKENKRRKSVSVDTVINELSQICKDNGGIKRLYNEQSNEADFRIQGGGSKRVQFREIMKSYQVDNAYVINEVNSDGERETRISYNKDNAPKKLIEDFQKIYSENSMTMKLKDSKDGKYL